MDLVVIVERHARWVLSWRVPNVLETDFRIEALKLFAAPWLFNSESKNMA